MIFKCTNLQTFEIQILPDSSDQMSDQISGRHTDVCLFRIARTREFIDDI